MGENEIRMINLFQRDDIATLRCLYDRSVFVSFGDIIRELEAVPILSRIELLFNHTKLADMTESRAGSYYHPFQKHSFDDDVFGYFSNLMDVLQENTFNGLFSLVMRFDPFVMEILMPSQLEDDFLTCQAHKHSGIDIYEDHSLTCEERAFGFLSGK